MVNKSLSDDHGPDGNDDFARDTNQRQIVIHSIGSFWLRLKPTLARKVCGEEQDAMGARLRWLKPTGSKYLRRKCLFNWKFYPQFHCLIVRAIR